MCKLITHVITFTFVTCSTDIIGNNVINNNINTIHILYYLLIYPENKNCMADAQIL